MSGNLELRAFRVSALDIFAPRPTIRFSVGSQYYYSGDHSSPTARLERSNSRRDRRPASPTEDKQWKRTSRIDDLADTLDAGALREILDRDKRRVEKKAKVEQERLRRRLERRAEKQNATAAAAGAAPPVPSRSDGAGTVGLGIEKEVAAPAQKPMQERANSSEDVRPATPSTPSWLHPLTPPPLHALETAEPNTPICNDNSQLPTPIETPMEDMIISDAQAVRYSRGNTTAPVHARGPSNVSMMPELLSERLAEESPFESIEQYHDPTRSGSLHPVDTIDTTTSKQGSSFRRRSSDGRRMSAFASFFRRGKRSSQEPGRSTPSEASFSNTSRESMSRQPLPAHLVATVPTAPIQIKQPSSVPRRTMSKFREDLPEFPVSPPDSRVASPEVPSTSVIAARRRTHNPADLRVGSIGLAANARSDSPVSPGLPVGNKMSQSLASVDSEGSWLSGKPVKRISNKSVLRSSVASSAVQQNPDFNNSFEELGMADDEYFRRLTPQPDEFRRSNLSSELVGRKASSTAIATLDAAAESDEEDEPTPSAQTFENSEHIKDGVARQPTVVHRNIRVKSAEGLLTMFDTDLSSPEETAKNVNAGPDSPHSAQSDGFTEEVTVQRAKSVDFGKQHVRHLSAGSAKLLDIQKRSSTASHSRLSQHE